MNVNVDELQKNEAFVKQMMDRIPHREANENLIRERAKYMKLSSQYGELEMDFLKKVREVEILRSERKTIKQNSIASMLTMAMTGPFIMMAKVITR